MNRWSERDERTADLWYVEEILRRDYHALRMWTADVARQIAATRSAGRATGREVDFLRARARRFKELADRATRFAEKEEAASG